MCRRPTVVAANAHDAFHVFSSRVSCNILTYAGLSEKEKEGRGAPKLTAQSVRQ